MPAITSYDETSATAKAFRALNKYGMNLADFAAATSTSSYTGFGNGTGYSVGNWISDGVFADLAAAQAVYPIIQDGNDHVDWVLLQSAVDFMIYGAMDTSAYGAMKRTLFIPAGRFLLNRTLHIGYAEVGTPPAGLNGNGYASITIQGEGRQVDPAGGGITGTTLKTEAYTYPGIAVSKSLAVQLKGFHLNGPGTSWMAGNIPYRAVNAWDIDAYNDPANSVAANQWGGAAVNIGIGLDLYSDGTSAAAYPARVLPSYFGGGTTTSSFGAAGGSIVEIEDVIVQGYTIGIGHPHGDTNGEFIRLKDVDIAYCVVGFVCGHSQNRNVSLTNVNFELMHTGISNRGGLQGNANLHGTYQNLHFGRMYQLLEHTNGSWSGPITFRDCYAESFARIGEFFGVFTLDGCALSFLEQDGSLAHVPPNHFKAGSLVLRNTSLSGLRHGLMLEGNVNSTAKIEISGQSSVSINDAHSNLYDGTATEQAAILAGQRYMQWVYQAPGSHRRLLTSSSNIGIDGVGNALLFSGDMERAELTYADQYFTTCYAQHPGGYPPGSAEMQGSVQWFPLPKITSALLGLTVSSRSGTDLSCNRPAIGDMKIDIGDVIGIEPTDGDAALRSMTWFHVVEAGTSTTVLRQLNNFYRGAGDKYSYVDNGWVQIDADNYNCFYWNTRIKQHYILWVGDVTSGSAVISNVKQAFQYGATDNFIDANFQAVVGDYHLHHEIERANTGGSGLKVHNQISAIDFTANTITLTENFNITRTNYPIVFYVRRYTA